MRVAAHQSGSDALSHDDALVIGGDDLSLEPALAADAGHRAEGCSLAYEPAEVVGPAKPPLQAGAGNLELVASRRADALAVERSRDLLAHRRRGVEIDPALAVDRHDDVPGSKLDVDQLETCGL